VRLAQVILFVRDVARMKTFYGQAFGLQMIEEDAGFCRLDGGGCVLMLHALGEPPSVEPRLDSFIKFAFHTDDVDATRNALVALGARMRDPHHFGNVTFCDGVDPEGNVFQITTR
jgi:predicted enzyme related to lactoylglutathione lyase